MSPTIWAHTLVKNEERYLWYAVSSVIDYVDKILIWDTGSSDDSVAIINELKKRYPEKVIFREVGDVDIEVFTNIRQKMLEETKADWLILVDGDEVWWNDGIGEIIKIINQSDNSLETIVNRYKNIVGDIFHYQEEKAGKYSIDGVTGHITIRAMNLKVPGLHFAKPHGQQGVFDDNEMLIQERDKKSRFFLNKDCYLHFTHMIRSTNLEKDQHVPKRDIKYKHELGKKFPLDFYYPETFFRERPPFVFNVWTPEDGSYYLRSFIETPFRKLKRRIIKKGRGY